MHCALLALLALGASGACAPSAPAETASGSFRGGGAVFDFGDVFEGVLLEHEFELEVLPGARPTVESARADCGCTVARLEVAGPGDEPRRAYVEGSVLAPGARLFVLLRYDTRGKVGAAPRTLSLYTNPDGKIEVGLRAKVEPWLDAAPDRFDLPPLDQERTRELAFVVTSARGEPFGLRPSGLALPPEVHVAAVARGGGERAAAWDVRVVLGPGLPRGIHAWPIELVSDVPVPVHSAAWVSGEPERTFALAPMVTVQVVGAILPSASSLSFGAVHPNEVTSRTLRLACLDPGVVFEEPRATLEPAREIDRPLQSCTEIHVKHVPGESAWDVELVLKDLDPALKGTFLAKLVVETNHPRDRSLEFPVTGFRVDAGGAPAAAENSSRGGRLAGPHRGN